MTDSSTDALHDRIAQVAEGYPFELERRGYLQAGAFLPEVVLDHPSAVKELHVVEALGDFRLKMYPSTCSLVRHPGEGRDGPPRGPGMYHRAADNGLDSGLRRNDE